MVYTDQSIIEAVVTNEDCEDMWYTPSYTLEQYDVMLDGMRRVSQEDYLVLRNCFYKASTQQETAKHLNICQSAVCRRLKAVKEAIVHYCKTSLIITPQIYLEELDRLTEDKSNLVRTYISLSNISDTAEALGISHKAFRWRMGKITEEVSEDMRQFIKSVRSKPRNHIIKDYTPF